MRIVINASAVLDRLTGVGNYVCYLTKELLEKYPDNHYWFYCGDKFIDAARLFELISGAGRMRNGKDRDRGFPLYQEVLLRWGQRLSSGMNRRVSSIWQNGDVYFEPNYVLVDLRAKKRIVTVHDLSFLIRPDWHTDAMYAFRDEFLRRIKFADSIITGSLTIKDEIRNVLGYGEEKVSVIYHGVDHGVFKRLPREVQGSIVAQCEVPMKIILFVGSIEPRKNLARLIKAHSILPRGIRKEYRLLLVGSEGWKNTEIRELVAKSAGEVVYGGYKSTDELVNLYNVATVLVYPSLYEGFGLPPLEAMSCGLPVVVSDIPVHREVCKDAAVYCCPLSEEDIAAKMLQVIEHDVLRSSLAEKGVARAQEFNWGKSASGHMEAFRSVL